MEIITAILLLLPRRTENNARVFVAWSYSSAVATQIWGNYLLSIKHQPKQITMCHCLPRNPQLKSWFVDPEGFITFFGSALWKLFCFQINQTGEAKNWTAVSSPYSQSEQNNLVHRLCGNACKVSSALHKRQKVAVSRVQAQNAMSWKRKCQTRITAESIIVTKWSSWLHICRRACQRWSDSNISLFSVNNFQFFLQKHKEQFAAEKKQKQKQKRKKKETNKLNCFLFSSSFPPPSFFHDRTGKGKQWPFRFCFSRYLVISSVILWAPAM